MLGLVGVAPETVEEINCEVPIYRAQRPERRCKRPVREISAAFCHDSLPVGGLFNQKGSAQREGGEEGAAQVAIANSNSEKSCRKRPSRPRGRLTLKGCGG